MLDYPFRCSLFLNLLELSSDCFCLTHSCARTSDREDGFEVGFGVGMLVGVVIVLSRDFHGGIVMLIGQFMIRAHIFLKSAPCNVFV